MPHISKDNPCYFFTSVAHQRLPIFRTDALKKILCESLDEARRSGKFSIYAYCVMPDHFHIITDAVLTPSNTLRYLNGISARRIIDHLKSTGHESSLRKLSRLAGGEHKYSVWQHHANTFIITSESTLMQKVNYVHQNPVAEGLADSAQDYLFSSARIWRRKALDNEPLGVDVRNIEWRVVKI